MLKPPGKDFDNTFGRKRPFTSSLFGSNAKINEGIPIVTAPTKVIFVGSYG